MPTFLCLPLRPHLTRSQRGNMEAMLKRINRRRNRLRRKEKRRNDLPSDSHSSN